MRILVFSMLLILASSLPVTTQTRGAKGGARGVVERTQAQVWAEGVADFFGDPHLMDSFPESEVAQRFRLLVPAERLKIGSDSGVTRAGGGNPGKGIVGLRFATHEAEDGKTRLSWVTVFMPARDLQGVDVASRVAAALRRKFQKPWRYYPVAGRERMFTWEQRKAFWEASVGVVSKTPDLNGTPEPGPWVRVNLGEVEGFGEP